MSISFVRSVPVIDPDVRKQVNVHTIVDIDETSLRDLCKVLKAAKDMLGVPEAAQSLYDELRRIV